MEYKRKLKKKIALNFVLLIMGVCALAAGFYFYSTALKDTFTSSYLMGTGTGLAIIGLIMAIKKIIILRDNSKFHAHKIENEDERNLLIAYKASHYSLVITTAGLYMASFFFAFFNETILQVIVVVICVLILARFILYFIIRKIV